MALIVVGILALAVGFGLRSIPVTIIGLLLIFSGCGIVGT